MAGGFGFLAVGRFRVGIKFFRKKSAKYLETEKKVSTFATAYEKQGV
jgi:hypothetical protein